MSKQNKEIPYSLFQNIRKIDQKKNIIESFENKL